MKLVVIDYGLCNLLSVQNALTYLKQDCLIASNPQELKNADAVILPGVGAFKDGMNGLKEKGFVEAIKEYVQTEKPFLGICLGMQMLLGVSYEFGTHEGLGLIPGEVKRFENEMLDDQHQLKIPHIGWNGLEYGEASWNNTILQGLDVGEQMYFVHSFYVNPENSSHTLANTVYGNQKFCSVVQKDNIYGAQFHPEKSATKGLTILDNFIQLVSKGEKTHVQ